MIAFHSSGGFAMYLSVVFTQIVSYDEMNELFIGMPPLIGTRIGVFLSCYPLLSFSFFLPFSFFLFLSFVIYLSLYFSLSPFLSLSLSLSLFLHLFLFPFLSLSLDISLSILRSPWLLLLLSFCCFCCNCTDSKLSTQTTH